MDIHKPKPWHGWREFLKEYLIIVVGVLTALGAEQAVEWLHWQHVATDARETIFIDQRRLIQQVGATDIASPCALQRLNALKAALAVAEQSGRLPAIAPLGPPPGMPWVMRGWDTLVSGQALPHFPHDLAMTLSSEASTLQTIRGHRDALGDEWASLRMLVGEGRPIDRSEIAAARGALGRAYWHAWRVRVSADALGQQIFGTKLLDPASAAAEWKNGTEMYRHAVGQTVCTAIEPSAPSTEETELAAPPQQPHHAYDFQTIRPGPQ